MTATDALEATQAALLNGRWADALALADGAIADTSDPDVIVAATVARGTALAQLERPGEALGSLQMAREREQAAGRVVNAAELALAQAGLQVASGEPQSAIASLVDAADRFGAAGEAMSQVRARLQLAQVNAMTGQLQPAAQLTDACVDEARRLGDAALLAEACNQSGSLHLGAGQLDATVASLREGLDAAERSGEPGPRSQLRCNLAIAISGQDPTRADALVSEAEALARTISDQVGRAGVLATAATAWRTIGRAERALRCGEEAVAAFRTAAAWPALLGAEVALADFCSSIGRSDLSNRYAQDALAVADRFGGTQAQAMALSQLGQLAFARGDPAAARNAFGAAARRLREAQLPVPPPLSAALSQLGVYS
ncbi:MAG TPA: hypothetical protein VMA77_15355 [Solirubrobacteraceae bacterium]|nr:hypothetical protein [Solirubrobacteraceae bacterium]